MFIINFELCDWHNLKAPCLHQKHSKFNRTVKLEFSPVTHKAKKYFNYQWYGHHRRNGSVYPIETESSLCFCSCCSVSLMVAVTYWSLWQSPPCRGSLSLLHHQFSNSVCEQEIVNEKNSVCVAPVTQSCSSVLHHNVFILM